MSIFCARVTIRYNFAVCIRSPRVTVTGAYSTSARSSPKSSLHVDVERANFKNTAVLVKAAELDQLLDRILSWCSEHRAKLIYGLLEDRSNLPTVCLHKDESAPLRAHIKVLTDLAPSVVVVYVQRLKKEDLEHKLDSLSELETSAELGSTIKEVQECRRFIGNVAEFDIQALVEKPPMILRIEDSAEWFDLIYGDEQQPVSLDTDADYEDPRTSDRVAALARRVAEDERFRLAKKRAQQELVAKSVLTKQEIGGNLFHIVQQASAIFEMEIKPKLATTK